MNKYLIALVLAVCLVQLSCFKVELERKYYTLDKDGKRQLLQKVNPYELQMIAAHWTSLTGSVTLAGGVTYEYAPDLSTQYSWVAYTGCKGHCNYNPNNQNTYPCNSVDCTPANLLKPIKKPILTHLITKQGQGVTVKTGFFSKTSANLVNMNAHNVDILLATSFANRANIIAPVSLSFGNHNNTMVTQLWYEKKINKPEFSFYLSDNNVLRDFLTVGTNFQFNTLGVRVTFPHNQKVYWNLQCNMIMLQKSTSAYTPYFKKATAVEFRFDVNSEHIQLPLALMNIWYKANPSCSKTPTKQNYMVCNCKNNINLIPELSFRFQGSAHYWKIFTPDFTARGYISPAMPHACIVKIRENTQGNFIVGGRPWLKTHYTVYTSGPNPTINIGMQYPLSSEGTTQSAGLIATIFVIGLIFIILTFVLLCCVCFKSITDVPEYVKPVRQVREIVRPQQVVYTQPAQVVYTQPQQTVLRQSRIVEQQPIATTSYVQQQPQYVVQQQPNLAQSSFRTSQQPVVYQQEMQNQYRQ